MCSAGVKVCNKCNFLLYDKCKYSLIRWLQVMTVHSHSAMEEIPIEEVRGAGVDTNSPTEGPSIINLGYRERAPQNRQVRHQSTGLHPRLRTTECSPS